MTPKGTSSKGPAPNSTSAASAQTLLRPNIHPPFQGASACSVLQANTPPRRPNSPASKYSSTIPGAPACLVVQANTPPVASATRKTQLVLDQRRFVEGILAKRFPVIQLYAARAFVPESSVCHQHTRHFYLGPVPRRANLAAPNKMAQPKLTPILLQTTTLRTGLARLKTYLRARGCCPWATTPRIRPLIPPF